MAPRPRIRVTDEVVRVDDDVFTVDQTLSDRIRMFVRGRIGMTGPVDSQSIPTGAITLRDSSYLMDRSGSYITARA